MNLFGKIFFFVVIVIMLTGTGLIAFSHLKAGDENNYHADKSQVAAVNVGSSSDFNSTSSENQADSSTIVIPKIDIGDDKSVPPQKKDQVTAESYLVANVDTGKVYLSSNPDSVMPVASMSKLITAIVSTNTISPTTTIEITPEEANLPPDGSMLKAGEKFKFSELLYPMLLDSSNVAAEAIASSTDLMHFLKLMSATAWEVNMPTAYFADPTGLSPHNEASANDIFALARYLYKYRPDILAITRIPHIDVATTTDHGAHNFDSIHPFVKDPRFIGGKTGRTPEAGETMLTLLRINDQPIAFIVMHSSYGYRASDTDLLIKKFEALHN
jgi:D-alanyl-D-alanine endopeptidase (penicillin-binding protein 7)